MYDLKAGLRIVFCLVLTLATSALVAEAQTTVYSDDFSGLASDPINGTTPDVSLSGATWAAGTGLRANGSTTGLYSGVLPFQPQPNHVYELSATLNSVSNSAAANNNWTGLGFLQLQPNLGARFLETGQPALWAMSRTNTGTQKDQSFLGFGANPPGNTVGGLDSTSGTGISADSIRLVLDTTGSDWQWSVDFNNDSVIDRTESISFIPSINFIGLTISAATLAPNSTVDNLLLTQQEFAINEWNVDGGGNFGTGTNWTMGVPAAGSNVLFGDILTAANAPAIINLNSAASLNLIQFANDQTYSIQGASTLTLTGDATVATYSGTHEIGARIAGTSGLRKTAGGTLVLSNDSNTFTGDLNIVQGTVEVPDLGVINQASGVVNVTTGATFRLGGDGAGNGASGTLTEQITGAGTVRLHNTLTNEVVGFASANPSFTGAIAIAGGTLQLQNSGALGSTGTTAAVSTQVTGGTETGTLELAGVTVTGERLQMDGRTASNAAPHLTSTGTSRWEGRIDGAAGGNQYNIEPQAGSSLTITGDFRMPDDTTTRFINLSGPAGSTGRVEGKFIDRTAAVNDGAENANVSVVKKGAGTWTIATGTGARDDFHQRDTVVEQGTLAIQAGAADAGELWSRSIQVRSGATLDVSSFGFYSLQAVENQDTIDSTGDEIGQELTGSGTVIIGAGTLRAFDDSIITPGDAVGTLTVSGNYSYATFTELGTGRWNYQLGSTTSPTVSDLVVVTGTATVNAGDANDVINVNISPVQGTLSSGAYPLVQAASVGGTAANNNYAVRVRDTQGNDITPGIRQSFGVSNSATTVDLNVTGASANLAWAGTAGSAWDVKTTNNWTGAGGPQFHQLDNVTFGNVANKNVTVNTNVAPGAVTFNGGVGSTYVVSGTGGMTGFGAVNVASGTVQLNNSGNSYAGTTTIQANARLEMVSATTGSIVANGALAVAGATTSTLIDNFNDGNISEFTTYTVLDQVGSMTTVGPPDDIVYSSTGTAITVNGAQAGNPAPEQALALRLASLAVGETLVVDANLNSSHSTFSTVGIAIANSSVQADVPPGMANADIRKGYIITGMRLNEPTDGQNTQHVQAAGGTVSSTGPGGIGEVTNLWITRTGANSYTTGHSKDGMATRVQTDSRTGIDWTPDSVGFYADIRGALEPNAGTMDNLRIARAVNHTLQVNGDLTLGSSGTIEFEIGQDIYDHIAVTGIASLAGSIEVELPNDFDIVNGAQYTLLTAAGGITDLGFDIALPENFTAAIVDSMQLVLTYSASLAGDFNNDGIVDSADYVMWRKTNTGSFTDWRQTYGLTSGPGNGNGGTTSTPEPTGLVLLAIALCLAGGCVRQSR